MNNYVGPETKIYLCSSTLWFRFPVAWNTFHQSHGYFYNAVKFKIQFIIKTDEYWICINEHKEGVLKMYHCGTCVTPSVGKALWIHFSELFPVLTCLFLKEHNESKKIPQKMFQPLKNKSSFRGAIWYNHIMTRVGSSNKWRLCLTPASIQQYCMLISIPKLWALKITFYIPVQINSHRKCFHLF